MLVEVLTYSPKAHIEVCSIIKMFESRILDSGVGSNGSYGFFTLETHSETLEALLLVSEIDLDWDENDRDI